MKKRKKRKEKETKNIRRKSGRHAKKFAEKRKEDFLFYVLIILLAVLFIYLVYSFATAGYTAIKKGDSLDEGLPTLLPFFGALGILLIVVVLFVIKVVVAKKDEEQKLSPTIKKTREIMARNPDLSVSG